MESKVDNSESLSRSDKATSDHKPYGESYEGKASNNNVTVNKEEDFASPEWALSLANLSTPLLTSKLTALKSQSATLASTLTAKLASSPSGQSLLHIGPSLSTLPPDLQSLLASLEPMLKEVEEYEKMNQTELIRVVTAGKLVETECRRAAHANECRALLADLIAAEAVVYSSSPIPIDSEEGAASVELNYMVSLERVAHTTLHLVHQLQKSSEQVTSTLNSNSNHTSIARSVAAASNDDKPRLPSMNTPLPQDTEKAQFMMKLAPRIRKLERGVIQIISKELERILQDRVKKNKEPSSFVGTRRSIEEELLILGYLFRSFALLGKGSEAELIFARVAIMPIVRSKVTLGKLDEGGSRGECAGLFCLLEDLACSIKDLWGDVLSLVEEMFQLDAGVADLCSVEDNHIEVDLVTAGVWVPIATALMTDPTIKMAIFSPGIASILQANYVALDTFLSELASNLLKPSPSTQSVDSKFRESLNGLNTDEVSLKKLYFIPEMSMDTIHSVQSRLYDHSMTRDFSKKWNLPIYYQLRFGEACTRLDEAINRVQKEGWYADVFTGTDTVAKELKETSGFELPFFLEVFDIMAWLWKENVYLKPLTHRFLRGSMQLLGRVVTFVDEGVRGNIKFGIESKQTSGNDEQNVVLPLRDASFFWHERIDDVAAVSWDLTILETSIGSDYAAKISDVILPPKESPHGGAVQVNHLELSELKSLVQDALIESAEGVSPIIQKMWNEIIVKILTLKCSAPLSAVKGVAATYRMTNRPPPTQASPYVSTILRPLKEFNSNFLNRTPPQVGFEWKRKVVASVAEKYCSAVSELTETVQRTEEALKNRKARRTSAGGMSDGEKVKLQLLLDQREFVGHVTDVGVEAESIEYVKKLISLTESAKSLLPKS
mmetsp:Transcript_24321/g.36236  ORF Transcript_24321/g.36236 Transcript_24321/m.36236 type:complete len:892 (-) Transcript_24321:125-2800(-)|eukprot:CAMPEP_0203678628 /NCGR_PEP_ID=MMETSP0090-20130426/32671_1 /ASSEMBLY_ACC=CAM_ASM_001088 /TAXON_ID=426623 /ORGANISM="Chaetoceros affinis, Strain CCMP159" /LENGTH=891 /DNA_ID=CAMNT_0050545959 /DNA_START=137 /DNA_END=2812 /DNA_ORIENTATION=+